MDSKRIEKLRNIEENRKSAQETKESMVSLVAQYLDPDTKAKTQDLSEDEIKKQFPKEMAQAKKRMENSRTPPPNELIELQYKQRRNSINIFPPYGGKKKRKSLKKKRKTRRKKGGGPAISVLPTIKETVEQINQVFEQPPRQRSLKPHSKPIVLEAARGLLQLSKGKKGGKRKGRKSLKKKKTKTRKTRKN